MSTLSRLVGLVVLLAGAACCAAPVRVAVWDPEQGTHESRFVLDPVWLDTIAQDLGASRVKTAALERLGERADVLVLPGDSVPKASIGALRQFADDGGVILALAAKVPFLVAIEQQPDGWWTMAPKTPTFAWQTDALLSWYGLKYVYNVGMHDGGVNHTVTPLLARYLPTVQAPGRVKLASNYLVSTGGEVYPLIRSQRIDGADVTPQLYVVQNGRRRAIVATLDTWCRDTKLVAALARLAGDLRSGAVTLAADQRVTMTTEPTQPLRSRQPLGSVEPEGAQPVVRWGKFDGTSFDLDEPLPPALAPGATARLPLPALPGGPYWLRVRGAYTASDAGLRVELAGQTQWNELFTYLDSGGLGNIGVPSLADVPAEFTRCVFLPAASTARELLVSNPGSKPLYLDAAQVETRPRPMPAMEIGLNGMVSFGGANPIAPALSSQWGALRANIRTQTILAPDKPDRFKTSEQKLEMYLAAGAPVQLLFEGTAQWDAISPQRYADGAGRPHTVPPDNARYAEVVDHFVSKYGDRVSAYEIWNETNIRQFWQGSFEEYMAFFKATAETIRRRQPQATIITGGMAGPSEPFVIALQESGALKLADRLAFHCYAGKSPAWDMTYGLHQGFCFSRGIDTEIYCNEQGFPWLNAEWFQPPPQFTPEVQAQLLDNGLARLLANGVAKLSVFHAGGDKHPYGLIDEKGQPRPAYAVFADYLPLGQRGGRRLDVALTGGDGQPLRGVFCAAAAHDDGGVSLVVNPAEVARLRRQEPPGDPSCVFTSLAGWITFFGKSSATGGVATVTVAADKTYAGFYRNIRVDVDRYPRLEVTVPACEKTFSLSLKTADKVETKLLTDQPAGTYTIDYRKLLDKGGVYEGELGFRVAGTTRIASVRFIADPQAPSRVVLPPPLPVVLRLPAAKPLKTDHGTLTLHQGWVELRLDLTGRTVVRLTPAG